MYDYFGYFDLPCEFDVDREALEKKYLSLVQKFHPDNVAGMTDFERKEALLSMSRINDAYGVLTDPVKRGNYMLKENGIDALDEKGTSFPPDFLMQQFEWRERLEEIANPLDEDALDDLASEVAVEKKKALADFSESFGKKDWESARLDIAKARFIDKLAEEMDRLRE